MPLPIAVREWRDDGRFIESPPGGGNRIYVLDTNSHPGLFVFILHGFPSSSYDWHMVVPALAKSVRVVTFDMLGYGLSDKPDQKYSLFEQADLAETVANECGIDRCVLVSHDMGDTVAAELMMRQAEGTLGFTIERSIMTNGSIFIDLVQLSAGQEFLLALPDERLPDPLELDGMKPGLGETFGVQPSDDELTAMVELIRHNGGDQLLGRLIRYIEERRENQPRWTQGLASFPGPMTALWGELDPIAVVVMMDRLAQIRPDTEIVRWSDVGHWPSLEVPDRVAAAILERL